MTNIEKLTTRINALQHPRAVYNALIALAPVIRDAREEGQQEALLEALEEGVRA